MASISFQATDTDASTIGSGNTYTFSLTVASAAGQERLVAVGGIHDNETNGDFTAVTVDGQAGTRVGTVSRGGGTEAAILTFYRAPGTAGTNINVVATNSGGDCFGGYCAVWSLNDADTLLATVNSASQDPTLSANTASGGVAAAVLAGYSGTLAVTWTGLTEVFDGVSVFGDDVFSGASLNIVSGSTPLAITAATDLGTSIASSVVSFNPTAGAEATLMGQAVM